MEFLKRLFFASMLFFTSINFSFGQPLDSGSVTTPTIQIAVIDGDSITIIDQFVDTAFTNRLNESGGDFVSVLKDYASDFDTSVETGEEVLANSAIALTLVAFILGLLAQFIPGVKNWMNNKKRLLILGVTGGATALISILIFNENATVWELAISTVTSTVFAAYIFSIINDWEPKNPILGAAKNVLLLFVKSRVNSKAPSTSK
jgi:hypothetical protein